MSAHVRAGRATLEDRTTGQRWTLEPGVLYCVGPKDKHRIIRDDARLRIISVFNPPLVGNETHDADGAYPPTARFQGRAHVVRTLEDVRQAVKWSHRGIHHSVRRSQIGVAWLLS